MLKYVKGVDMLSQLIRYTRITDIIGDMLKIKAKEVGLEDIAVVHHQNGNSSLAKVVELEGEFAFLQIFSGSKGVSTGDEIHFLHHPMRVAYSEHILGRIGFQANADIIVFGGMGLIFDDYHFFKTAFEEHNVMHKTVMFVNRASDPTVERLMIPDLALSVAEKFAVEEGKRVLVLLTDMTAYADAMKEIGIAQERIPAVRGYMGDLYTQLARRYEKACDFKGAGSVTILSTTLMPGDDVTHPVPDNTGYITEGQFYLHGGVIDPFGSLSRLKQNVIGKETREDHSAIMNTMIRLYSGGQEAKQKQAMAFELSPMDEKLLKFGDLFHERFMNINVSLKLDDALNLAWQTLAECFEPQELLMKEALIARYYPKEEFSDAQTLTQ